MICMNRYVFFFHTNVQNVLITNEGPFKFDLERICSESRKRTTRDFWHCDKGISAIMKMFAQKLRSPPSLPQALLISHSPSVALALLLSPSALSSSNATLEAWSLPCEYETAEMAISEFTSIYSLRDRRGKKERESENGKEKDKG